jgi:hypothetical protein
MYLKKTQSNLCLGVHSYLLKLFLKRREEAQNSSVIISKDNQRGGSELTDEWKMLTTSLFLSMVVNSDTQFGLIVLKNCISSYATINK